MDREAWRAAVHGVAKSRTQLSNGTELKCESGLPWWLSGKEFTRQCRRHEFNPWVGKIPWRRKWQPTPVVLPRRSQGQRSLVGYSPWVTKSRDSTKQQQQHNQCKYIFYIKKIYMCVCIYIYSGLDSASRL